MPRRLLQQNGLPCLYMLLALIRYVRLVLKTVEMLTLPDCLSNVNLLLVDDCIS
jgi:hypothetical protein